MSPFQRQIPRRRFLAGAAVAIAAAAVPACRPGDDLQVEPVEQLETGGLVPHPGFNLLVPMHETILSDSMIGDWDEHALYTRGEIVFHDLTLWVAVDDQAKVTDLKLIPSPQVDH